MIDRESAIAYNKLLRYGRPVSVRGFQRLMGYRSPGKAQRVLERLCRLGLATRVESGDYAVSKNLPPYLAAYIVIKGLILPRSLVFAVFSTATALTYIVLVKPVIYITLLLLILVVPYWFETIYYRHILKQIMGRRE